MDIHMGIPTGENHIPILNQFHGYEDPYWDIRMDIHTDIPIWIPIPMQLG